MSASQRRKGQSGEREAAAKLSEAFGTVVKRKLSASRDGGDDIEAGPYSVEVKRRKGIAASRFMDQAAENAEGKTPVVMMREDGGQWLVMMRFDEWARIARGEM